MLEVEKTEKYRIQDILVWCRNGLVTQPNLCTQLLSFATDKIFSIRRGHSVSSEAFNYLTEGAFLLKYLAFQVLQMTILRDLLLLLQTATEPGTLTELPYKWRRSVHEKVTWDSFSVKTEIAALAA
jgi:hypothetical protein